MAASGRHRFVVVFFCFFLLLLFFFFCFFFFFCCCCFCFCFFFLFFFFVKTSSSFLLDLNDVKWFKKQQNLLWSIFSVYALDVLRMKNKCIQML